MQNEKTAILQCTTQWLDVTLPTPAQNLALDEVLLNQVDADPSTAILRTWEPLSHFVVVGRSNRVEMEVNEPRCRSEGVPVFRRASGGGAVIVGPGCLAYALVLPLDATLRTSGVTYATRMVMDVIASSLGTVDLPVSVCGTSDLVIHDRKFSGNSQRWLKNAFLHHGTILYDYDLTRIERLLRTPSREPEYRSKRPHGEFLTNFPIPRDQLVDRLVTAWKGQWASCGEEALVRTRQLAESRYANHGWNYER